MNINRIIFLGQDGVFVKVGRHNTDSTKLVLKSNSVFAPSALCKAFGVEEGDQWKGSVHVAIMPVDKLAFLAGLGAVSEALQTQPKALAAPGICPECSGANGAHWGHCSNHPENKPN